MFLPPLQPPRPHCLGTEVGWCLLSGEPLLADGLWAAGPLLNATLAASCGGPGLSGFLPRLLMLLGCILAGGWRLGAAALILTLWLQTRPPSALTS